MKNKLTSLNVFIIFSSLVCLCCIVAGCDGGTSGTGGSVRSLTLAGTIQYSDGTPTQDVEIHAFDVDDQSRPNYSKDLNATFSDKDGKFVLEIPSDKQRLALMLQKDNQASSEIIVDKIPPGTKKVQFTIECKTAEHLFEEKEPHEFHDSDDTAPN